MAQEYAPGWRALPCSGLQPNVAQECALHWRTLSHYRLWPNVALEYAPCWRTLSHCGLWPNVTLQILLLIERLCPNADSGYKRPKTNEWYPLHSFDGVRKLRRWLLHHTFIRIANFHNYKLQWQMTHLVGILQQMTQIAHTKITFPRLSNITKRKGIAFHQIYLDNLKIFCMCAMVFWLTLQW